MKALLWVSNDETLKQQKNYKHYVNESLMCDLGLE